jgi:phosphoribosyl 1,2-cyclic phosphodiesterase
MKLTVLSSGSAGNGYVLEGRNSALLIECGVSPERMIQATDFPLSKLAACLVSHEHGDHAAYVARYQSLGLMVYASEGTFRALGGKAAFPARGGNFLRPMTVRRFGEWVVKPFDVVHDAEEPLGFIIEHPELGRMLFVTDTKYVKYGFRKERLDHILVEANYSDEVLDENVVGGLIDGKRAARVRDTHLSLRAACELAQANETPALKTVVMIHLSSQNSRVVEFAERMRKAVFLADVYVARAGLTIELNNDVI